MSKTKFKSVTVPPMGLHKHRIPEVHVYIIQDTTAYTYKRKQIAKGQVF